MSQHRAVPVSQRLHDEDPDIDEDRTYWRCTGCGEVWPYSPTAPGLCPALDLFGDES